MNIFHIDYIAFSALGYSISYIELTATIMGFISVYYATRGNILTWSTGIVNEIALCMLFFQIQLYADMFLQIYFFIVTLYGWRNWSENKENISITNISLVNTKWLVIIIVIGSGILWICIKYIHTVMPILFDKPASLPFADSFITVASVIATILLAKKKVETWILWITVDVVSIVVYFYKEIYFLSLEYIFFLGLAIAGYVQWKNKITNE